VSRTVRWQLLIIGLGMALAGILLTYLALKYVVREVPTVGGTYVEGIAGTPHYVNPLLSDYNEADEDLCALVFSGLTRFNSRGEVVPELARSWDISPDGQTYTFHLRTDVRWHDDRPFTADDVLFTVDLLQDPDYPGPPDVGGLWRTVQVEKIDNYTVQFLLSEPLASFLDFTTIGLLPSHLLQDVRAAELTELDFNLSPIGTGPFQVQEVEVVDGAITSVLLQRNADYYGYGPLLEHVRLQFYPTYQSVLRAYEAGEVEGVSRILQEDLPRAYAEENENLTLYTAPLARYALVFLNLNQPEELPFFQDVEVRQALLYGLDREEMIHQLLGEQGMVAHSPIVANTWAYDEEIRRYDYDPAQARALLAEGGWALLSGRTVRTKQGVPFSFTLLASTDPSHIAMAEEIARQWRQLNIEVEVQTLSPVALREALEQRNYEAALVELAMPGDPDPYPLWHQTQITVGQNYAGLNHRRISELLETARVIVNRDRRTDLYHEFQTLFADEVPAILLYNVMYTYGVDQKVKGVQIAPLMQPSDRFSTITHWHVAQRRVIVSQSEAP
jgi:peptide/nickel transport system substrate-binding protein